VIARLDRTALEWAYDARYLVPRRTRAVSLRAPVMPRDLEDRIQLSPAAVRLLEQAVRLSRRPEVP